MKNDEHIEKHCKMMSTLKKTMKNDENMKKQRETQQTNDEHIEKKQ